eukprot:gnl/MRDRNA2_/MRDRNA2_127415_c0_seq1.p1 gnl/MRDRNA2_/MRDRNA2_127415_c0~~gnl/MRDRNA2_/MRDRNA2_127415_c0_seq1.p1  ORF type:complete len:132 (-),score=13.81 gnl/MRDRNA2_/MRDRNA2_127415_c0_seq1:100-495(-)
MSLLREPENAGWKQLMEKEKRLAAMSLNRMTPSFTRTQSLPNFPLLPSTLMIQMNKDLGSSSILGRFRHSDSSNGPAESRENTLPRGATKRMLTSSFGIPLRPLYSPEQLKEKPPTRKRYIYRFEEERRYL